jgi:hypothetical protein
MGECWCIGLVEVQKKCSKQRTAATACLVLPGCCMVFRVKLEAWLKSAANSVQQQLHAWYAYVVLRCYMVCEVKRNAGNTCLTVLAAANR